MFTSDKNEHSQEQENVDNSVMQVTQNEEEYEDVKTILGHVDSDTQDNISLPTTQCKGLWSQYRRNYDTVMNLGKDLFKILKKQGLLANKKLEIKFSVTTGLSATPGMLPIQCDYLPRTSYQCSHFDASIRRALPTNDLKRTISTQCETSWLSEEERSTALSAIETFQKQGEILVMNLRRERFAKQAITVVLNEI